MRVPDILRYGLWCGIVATAEANRRHYRMTTTWLPHLLANTLALLLPDLYRALRKPRFSAAEPWQQSALSIADRTIASTVCDNPYYVVYVAPLAVGYLLSSPRFNIYKGDLADVRLAGFGLDALPHSTTALALTLLIGDTLQTAAKMAPARSPISRRLLWCKRRQGGIAGAIVALVTLIWELGEYRIYKHEFARRGDMRRINMQWSASDTAYDCLSNAIGWALGLTLMWHREHALNRSSGDRQV